MVILFDMFNMPEDVFEVVFATEQQTVVAKMLTSMMIAHGGVIGKTEMSLFANKVHEGTLVDLPQPEHSAIPQKQEKISYNKRQFYDRILTPMKSMGMIDYDLYRKVYKLSDKFNKNLLKVGLMWNQRVRDHLPTHTFGSP